MNRTALGAGIVIVLAVVLFLVLRNEDNGGPATTTTSAAAPITTTSEPPATTLPSTTTPPDTTTAAPSTTSDLTAREAEIEALVKELDLMYWQALYAEDLELVADVVGGQRLYENSLELLETGNPFLFPPTSDLLRVDVVEILLDRDDCLAVDIDEQTLFREAEDDLTQLLLVLWPVADTTLGWRLASVWAAGTPQSVWVDDCDILDRGWRP